MEHFKRHNFKKLKVWQMGIDIAKDILNITDTFSVSEKYELKSQIDIIENMYPPKTLIKWKQKSKDFKKQQCHFKIN